MLNVIAFMMLHDADSRGHSIPDHVLEEYLIKTVVECKHVLDHGNLQYRYSLFVTIRYRWDEHVRPASAAAP